jgi:phenylalanyl-tRNA synthetase beta chain
MGELDLDALLELASPAQPAGERERFPAVYLDLAMAVPEGVKAAEILESARAAGGENLEDVRLIDVYRGEQVGEGSKSLALTLVFRSPDRTLTEAEALVGRDSIASAIAGRHGGRVRA